MKEKKIHWAYLYHTKFDRYLVIACIERFTGFNIGFATSCHKKEVNCKRCKATLKFRGLK